MGEASCSSSSSSGSAHGSEYEVERMLMPSQSQCKVLVRLDGASTSGLSSASGSWPLSVEVVSSIDGEEDSADSKVSIVLVICFTSSFFDCITNCVCFASMKEMAQSAHILHIL